ncbi:MAG: hypothetical protein J6Y97_07395 [Prevotella sp.]|nr:hypothetical protein [Prevotella sp.]
MNIFIILDRPSQANDKKWLIDAMEKAMIQENAQIIPVYSSFVTSVAYRRGLWGKLRVVCEYLRMSVRFLRQSRKEDVAICWTPLMSYILYLLMRCFMASRKVVSLNWLHPSSGRLIKWVERKIVSDPKVRVVVNTPATIDLFVSSLGINRPDAFRCIPDVYDTRIPFNKNVRPHFGSHFFTGGMNNRDWGLIVGLAKAFPRQSFVCCALKDDFFSCVSDIPDNMKVMFDVPSTEYYRLLSEAFAVLLPLRSKRASGLINIIRAAQEGVLCLTTSIPATEQYYGEGARDLLMPFDASSWEDKVRQLLALSEDAYISKCRSYASYIEEEFSPENAVGKIISAIP